MSKEYEQLLHSPAHDLTEDVEPILYPLRARSRAPAIALASMALNVALIGAVIYFWRRTLSMVEWHGPRPYYCKSLSAVAN